MKKCRKCGIGLVEGGNWYKSHKKKNDYICIECHKARRRQRYKENPTRNRIITCNHCGREKRLYASGLCITCYRKSEICPLIICVGCGEKKPHWANGLCSTCYRKRWNEDNAEHVQEYQKQYYRENHEHIIKYHRQYYQKNKEKSNAQSRQWCKDNTEYHKARMRKWHAEHREQQTEYRRGYYREHHSEFAEYNRQYNKKFPEVARKYNQTRRARLVNAIIEIVDEQKIYRNFNNECFYCGGKDDLTLDHIVPLSKGGRHAEENLVVSCRSCNSSKRDKPLMGWLRTQSYSQVWLM